VTGHRVQRGRETEALLAQMLREEGWPYAMPAGAGRAGPDITGTPGLHFECKARTRLDLSGGLRQADGHGDGLPILVLRLNGQGPAAIRYWPAVLRLGDLIGLLRAVGYPRPKLPDTGT